MIRQDEGATQFRVRGQLISKSDCVGVLPPKHDPTFAASVRLGPLGFLAAPESDCVGLCARESDDRLANPTADSRIQRQARKPNRKMQHLRPADIEIFKVSIPKPQS